MTGPHVPAAGAGQPDPRLPRAGDQVVAVGLGVTGVPVVRHLAAAGVRVVATADRLPPPAFTEIAAGAVDVAFAGDLQRPPDGTAMVVTSAGIRPDHPLLASAAAAGIEVIGEAELAWRLDHAAGFVSRPWLVVTGTNGKTTTVGMLEAILAAAGRRVTACGNIGWPVLEAVLADPRQEAIAAELSSFQLHYAPGIRPRAGAVLNLAEDHLDWHGTMQAYGAAKAVALSGDIAVAAVDDPGARALLEASPAPRTVGVTIGPPGDGQIGLVDTVAVDLAFGRGELFDTSAVRLPGRHNLVNAMTAAALALALDVPTAAVDAGLAGFAPGAHRNQLVATVGGVRYVDDSKATNPHAAAASLLAYRRVVWIAGGQLKGAAVDELVASVADRLAGVVLLGVDAAVIETAVARHAPDVPRIRVPNTDDGAMMLAVRAARRMAAPGDVVLLAPAAASLDMFSSYAARGQAFADAARDRPAGGEEPR